MTRQHIGEGLGAVSAGYVPREDSRPLEHGVEGEVQLAVDTGGLLVLCLTGPRKRGGRRRNERRRKRRRERGRKEGTCVGVTKGRNRW